MLATILASITFLWHWGQSLKSDYVRTNKIMLGDLLEEDTEGKQTQPPTAGKFIVRHVLNALNGLYLTTYTSAAAACSNGLAQHHAAHPCSCLGHLPAGACL